MTEPDTGSSRGRLACRVSGRVQGVGFRFFVLDRAGRLGLDGHAANMPDGSVEVVAEGRRQALDELVEALRRGPPASHVEDVAVRWESPSGEGQGFQIR